MDKRIKKSIAAVILFIAAAAAAITVYAYLQREQTAVNQFTIGEDTVSISEEWSEPDTVLMDNQFNKKVQVTNTGDSEQFVRVYMDFSDTTVRDKSKIVYTKNDSTQEKTWEQFLSDLPDGWTYISESEPNDGTTLGGYFYYTKVLPAGGTTPALIDGVKTTFGNDDNDDNTDKITDFDIIVYTETVQTTETGNGAVYGDDQWKDAWKSFLNVT